MVVSDFEGLIDVEDSVFNFNDTNGVNIQQSAANLTSAGSNIGETSLNFHNENQHLINLAEKHESERAKALKPARPSFVNKFKIGFGIFYNSEFWGNKGDGLKMNHLRCHLINCRIR
jgi:hypothetical protein